jgi:6-pyruvoyltetrahydropterin/6-carboxytetrahydropterin synthase
MMTEAKGELCTLYIVAIKQEFIAQHYLIGDAPESEKQRHSHSYQVEVQCEGSALNEQGYLVDIDEIEFHLTRVLAHYEDKMLNDLPEFKGLNPSIEHLSRILCRALSERLKVPNVKTLTVRVWERANAWALYRQDLPCASG